MAHLRFPRHSGVLLIGVLIGFCFPREHIAIADLPATSQPGEVLPPDDAARYAALQAAPLHGLKNVDLADFMRLRKLALGGQLPEPAPDIGFWALKGIGQPFRLSARSHDLSESDCVTFSEWCIALGCTDDWRAAYRLQNRLRCLRGWGSVPCLHRDAVAEWIPSNSWLFDDITQALGAVTATFDVELKPEKVAECLAEQDLQPASSDRLTVSHYLPKEALLGNVADRLQTGDIIFVISRFIKSGVWRARCIHQAIVYRDGPALAVIHSTPPAVAQWPLDRLFAASSVLGCKVLRLKPNARQLVLDDFAHLEIDLNVSPQVVDSSIAAGKGDFAFMTATRDHDGTLVRDDIVYGFVDIRQGETLWSLFGPKWKSLSNLAINHDFMTRYPDLRAESYAGARIYYPLRPASVSK